MSRSATLVLCAASVAASPRLPSGIITRAELVYRFHMSGGWGGIRTLETLARLPVFKTGAFNHSATHPARIFKSYLGQQTENGHRIATGRARTVLGLDHVNGDALQEPLITSEMKSRVESLGVGMSAASRKAG